MFDNLYKDLFVGGIIGISQGIIGHPMDTLKIIKQNNTTIKKQNIMNIKGFYRGFSYPLYVNFISNLIVFPIFDNTKKYLNSLDSHNECSNSYKNSFFAGALSGVIVGPLVFIFDIGKIQKQMYNKYNFNLYNIKKTKGLSATYAREIIAYGSYFYTYDLMKNHYECNSFFSGVMAGFVNWTITYPIDVLKTQQMTYNLTLYECIKKNRSLLNYFNGYSICMIRSFFVNGTTFYIYDKLKNMLY